LLHYADVGNEIEKILVFQKIQQMKDRIILYHTCLKIQEVYQIKI